MMSNDLVKITFNGTRLEKVQGDVEVFITKELEEWMLEQRSVFGNQLASFKRGMGLSGLVPLIEMIESKKSDAKVIFNRNYSGETNGVFYINYHEYRSVDRSSMHAYYRARRLFVAQSFLRLAFPNSFGYGNIRIARPRININKIRSARPSGLTTKNKIMMLQQAIANINRVVEEHTGTHNKEAQALVMSASASSNILRFQNGIEELNSRLERKTEFSETGGKDSWQKWIHQNRWIFGDRHRTLIEKKRVGSGSIPDYLFPTIDGFLDILEIKRPSHPAIKKDDSHAGSYIWSATTNEAIGQVVTYLHEIELHQLEISQKLSEEYPDLFDESDLSVIKPRAFILIGRSNEWTPAQRRAFRKLNYSLHGIEVLTYDDLLTRGQHIIDMYSKDFSGDGENL